MNLDRLRKSRKAERCGVTRVVNKLKALLSEELVEPEGWVEIEAGIAVLAQKEINIRQIDQQIMEALLDADADDAELEAEVEGRDVYSQAIFRARALYDARKANAYAESESSASLRSAKSSGFEESQAHSRPWLPKIEWIKFSGDIRDWLRFWSQFEIVDEDPNLKPQQKYQYLIQATSPGSRAREIVESFPPTKESYAKAVESLKSRFGREDLLVECYQRELLTLVVHNIAQKGKVPLTQVYDKIETQIRALETLGVTKDKSAGLLYPLVESCLNEDLLRVWQRTTEYRAESAMERRLDNLMDFMKNEVEGEVKISVSSSGFGLKEEIKTRKKKEEFVEEKIQTAASLVVDEVKTYKEKQRFPCIFCEKAHASEHCLIAQSMTLGQRTEKIKASGACFACLNKHRIANCRARIKCVVCEGRHLPILCRKLYSQKPADSEKISKNLAIGVLANSSGVVLLQTLTVRIKSNKTQRIVRALIDTGSQRSYVLTDVAATMGLVPSGKEKLSHAVFGGSVSSQLEHFCYKLNLSDLKGKYNFQVDVLDQSNICGSIPSAAYTNSNWFQELKDKGIAVFDKEGPIEVLLGADFTGRILTGNNVRLKSGLVAVETHLGWTVMGRVPKLSHDLNVQCSMLATSGDSIAKLWELDVLGIEDTSAVLSRKEADEAVQQHFLETVEINEEGRYEVHLPWLPDHLPLPTNYNLARKRLSSAITKLNQTGCFEKYDTIFKEWMSEGIIEPVPPDQLEVQGHYMPHRPVFRESLTTPIRPVFDASARQTNFPSLNQCLSKGVNLLELIPSLILKFRLKKFGVVSDIRKAFLQISLIERDRNFVRFLWVDESGNVIQYRHARVVFGVTSSPYLLGAVILYHLRRMREGKKYPDYILDTLDSSFYCDNCVTSVDTKEELEKFIKISTDIFLEGKFELRGWEYSDTSLPPDSRPTSVLGFVWNRVSDTIQINTKSLEGLDLEGKLTKRVMTSVVHKIFDPVGLTAPAVLLPKLLLQTVAKLKWDDEVTESIKKSFTNWAAELPLLNQISIPRFVGSINREDEKWSLHTFADASKNAFGCVCFLKIESERGTFVNLIQAKSRVVPADCTHSIPRLELIACLLGARLAGKILMDLGKDVTALYWSDSSTAVAWIKREEEWASFVGNRVKEIRRLTDADAWKHIPGQFNPADLPSRGCSIRLLLSSHWWEGPNWLQGTAEKWPTEQNIALDEEDVAREKKKRPVISTVATAVKEKSNQTQKNPWYNTRFGKFSQNVRVVGWMTRFIGNCREKRKKETPKENDGGKHRRDECINVPVTIGKKGRRRMRKFKRIHVRPLDTDELVSAEMILIRLVQMDHFTGPKDSKIQHLASFYDENGVLRLKTRIMNRDDDYYFRAPVILPGKSEVVRKIIWQQHILNHHVGVQGLLTILRERYWVLFGRKTVKATIKNCVVCQRESVKQLETPICPLPLRRVEDAAVFATVGVDLAGPLHVKENQKVWVAIYTCAVYRAVHLEVLSSLSTDAFLMSFRRFVARRGRPDCIYSDNGTNFKGADNAFAALDWKVIEETTSLQRIKWIFSPPAGPWWGGWWERLIRMMKNILRKTLGRARVTLEELTTIICDCESLMNARPLTYVGDDPKDLEPLTPAMFLRDIVESRLPEVDEVEDKSLETSLLRRQKIRKNLRKRFRAEYLGQLVQPSWKEELRKISIGDVVLIGNDDSRRRNWPLARVEELFPGRDGQPRVARLRTGGGQTVTRPLQRLYLLEGATPCEQQLRSFFGRGRM